MRETLAAAQQSMQQQEDPRSIAQRSLEIQAALRASASSFEARMRERLEMNGEAYDAVSQTQRRTRTAPLQQQGPNPPPPPPPV